METTRNIETAGPARGIESISQLYLVMGRFFSYPGRAALRDIAKTRGFRRTCALLWRGLPFGVKFEGIPSLPFRRTSSNRNTSIPLTSLELSPVRVPLQERRADQQGNLGGASLLLWTFRRQAERHGKDLPGPPGGGAGIHGLPRDEGRPTPESGGRTRTLTAGPARFPGETSGAMGRQAGRKDPKNHPGNAFTEGRAFS